MRELKSTTIAGVIAVASVCYSASSHAQQYDTLLMEVASGQEKPDRDYLENILRGIPVLWGEKLATRIRSEVSQDNWDPTDTRISDSIRFQNATVKRNNWFRRKKWRQVISAFEQPYSRVIDLSTGQRIRNLRREAKFDLSMG
jgi:hypothetical protein